MAPLRLTEAEAKAIANRTYAEGVAEGHRQAREFIRELAAEDEPTPSKQKPVDEEPTETPPPNPMRVIHAI